jgi:hypothetical protein
MLLPESDGVVWFCAIQKVDAPLPPAQEAVPQDPHPDICSIWLNTFAPAGGVGNAEELADAEAIEAGAAVVVAVDVESGAAAVFGVAVPAEVEAVGEEVAA